MIKAARNGKLKNLVTSAEECPPCIPLALIALAEGFKFGRELLKKCFPGSAMVETTNGPKAMSSLLLGEHVATYREGEGLVFTEVGSSLTFLASSLVGWTVPPPKTPPTSASPPPPASGSPSLATTPCSGSPPPGPWSQCTLMRWWLETGWCRGVARGCR